MTLLAFAAGHLLPAATGWLLLRLVEGRAPVLGRLERVVLGFLAGTVLTMFLVFLLTVTAGLPLSRIGFLAVQVLTPLALLAALRLRLGTWLPSSPRPALPAARRPLHPALRALIVLLVLWTGFKILVAGSVFLLTPPGFDDTLKNWNMRGKIFHVTETFTATDPGGSADLLGQLHGYPPTVSLFKAWLASIAGEWNEGLVNTPHLVWFLCALALAYCFIRRFTPARWALLGSYLLASLPLYAVHGTQAYADLFLSLHVLAPAGLLSLALAAKDRTERATFFRLAALFLAFLPLTKNEGLVLYLPILLAGAAGSLIRLVSQGTMKREETFRTALAATCFLALTVVPWVAWKWAAGFTFGNAKALTGLSFSFQPLALTSAGINLLFQGNWLLLFPLLAAALVLARRRLLDPPLMLLAWTLFAALALQLFIFSATSLSAEALTQTGFSRGVVHIVPVAVVLLVLLVYRLLEREYKNI